MALVRGIAKITDVQSAQGHILLSCSMASAAAVAAPAIGPAGSVVGTATFADNKMIPGSAGSILFQDIDPNNQLRHEGQLVMTVSSNQVSKPDNTGVVSRSMGDALAAAQYLATFRTAANVTKGYWAVNAAEQITGAPHNSDTITGGTISTVGKADEVEICMWWKGNIWGILVDGGDICGEPKARTNFEDNVFYKVYIGATGAGTVSPLISGQISNVVITRCAPRFREVFASIGMFGDSYVTGIGSTNNTHPSWDNYVYGSLNRILAAKRKKVGRFYAGGNSGHSLCDTSALNLSSVFAAYAAGNYNVDIIVAGNNDYLATQAQVEHVTTGTDAHIKSWITTLAAQPKKQKIIVVTGGSLRQHVTLDTAANNANKLIVDSVFHGLEAWVETTFPDRTWEFHLVDLFALLGGDADGNENYQGQCNTYGNIATGGSAAAVAIPADRHPSSIGNKLWLEAVARLL